ncbi:tripartite tricarboxylate transporter substrate binding protein [Roseiarcaceae bacterium H3SJ34-1]|uniref:Bug family tripartite tricarboxylate transporter substrate binding protein n=1 Tax=Terripilifer ovatus TaxID=3032367 RepID=UPI003AB97567|nr:tripartite tricarboxylate transporter substrate binding protein [Roseiarcaceae bacterium H3SJ34-1]
MISRREILLGAAGASLAAPALMDSASGQQAWPNRDIHAICGFPPGTGADVFVRFYGKMLQDRVGRTVITENKSGAFGNIASEYVAKSKPDGYTIYINPGSSFLAAAPALFKKLPFDPINDFEHVTTLAKLPFLLLVAGDSPYKDVAGLVKALREKGDKSTYGSLANTGLVGSELFKVNFGLSSVEVKYKDAGALFNDLLGGNIDFVHLDPGTSSGQMLSGKVRALATTSKERFKALPDVPSAAEAGIANSDLIAWWSVEVPKGTPKPILDRLEKEFNAIAASEEHLKFAASLGNDPFLGNSTMLKELLIKDTRAWSEYVKLAKIEPL